MNKIYLLRYLRINLIFCLGLSRKWKQPLYCSQVTANLVRKQFKLSPNLIRVLPMKEPRLIGKVEVVLIDANHCPGIMLTDY